MDLQKLYILKHWLEYSSYTLSLENYIVLTNSLLMLKSETHFKKLFFWGVIQGIEADYFICYGYDTDALRNQYFYSDDLKNWKILPKPEKDHLALTELCQKPFQGDPGLVIEVVDDAPPQDLFPDQGGSVLEESEADFTTQQDPEEPEENKDEENVTEEEERSRKEEEERSRQEEEERSKSSVEPSLGKSELSITRGELKEENRLAAIVQIITNEAGVIPRGGIFKQVDGRCVYSRAFEGIKLEDADSLCSFQHYRIPWNDINSNLLTRCDYNYAIDFLDTIDKDIPEDCWSAQLVEGDRTIILRNLHWPGFTFFHHLNSPEHGFIYVGPGHRNLDIPFMTQVMLPIKEVTEEETYVEEEERPRTSIEASLHSQSSQHSTRLSTKVGTIAPGTKLETKLQSKLGAGPVKDEDEEDEDN